MPFVKKLRTMLSFFATLVTLLPIVHGFLPSNIGTFITKGGGSLWEKSAAFSSMQWQRPASIETNLEKEEQNIAPTSKEASFDLTFPLYSELAGIGQGQFIASSPFTVESFDGEEEHRFRVLLYPRGGGISSANNGKAFGKDSNNKEEEGGFGMSYKVVPLFQNEKDDKLGVYLQYLPKGKDSSVDLSFGLRLKGCQISGPKFDVELSSGMRFVSEDLGKLSDGTANDFGAHLMQSRMLPSFLGAIGNDDTLGVDNELQVEVKTKVFPSNTNEGAVKDSNSLVKVEKDTDDSKFSGGIFTGGQVLPLDDIRFVKNEDGTISQHAHNTNKVRVGKIVVPILSRLKQRPRMFEIGAYPGVEYRIMKIFDPAGKEVFESMPGADYELKPVYPLVSQLEREWPVRVNESEIPKLYTAGMYNGVSAAGSLFTAVAGLTAAFILSQLVSLFFIPSKSMDPTLEVGDVLVVEKVTPRFKTRNNIGDVVLFTPNERLRDIVSSSGGRISDRDLFVKRVAAGPGDDVSVDSTGSVRVNGKPTPGQRDLCDAEPLRLIEKYIQPLDGVKVPKDDVFVMGDCSSVSVDSRVWGPLHNTDIVGRPLFRIWPLERFGSVPMLPMKESVSEWRD